MLKKFLGAALLAAMICASGGGSVWAQDVTIAVDGDGVAPVGTVGGDAPDNATPGTAPAPVNNIVDSEDLADILTDTLTGGAGGKGGAGNEAMAGSAGGDGGNVTITWTNSLPIEGEPDEVTTAVTLTGGAGGDAEAAIDGGDGTSGPVADGYDGADGAAGGKGGSVSLTYGGNALLFSSGADLTLTAGDGGDGTIGGDGGKADTGTGSGGKGGKSGSGGKGGSVSFTAAAADVILDDATIELAVGAAGAGTVTAGNVGSGGTPDSGKAHGAAGAAGALALGGDASFTAASLSAGEQGGTFTLSAVSAARSGRYNVNIGAVNAVNGDLTLDFYTSTGTLGAVLGNKDAVNIGTITIGNTGTAAADARTLDFGDSVQDVNFKWNKQLTVVGAADGTGHTLTGALDASKGGVLTFNMTGVTGGTMLTGTVDVDRTTTINIEGDISSSMIGKSVNLVTNAGTEAVKFAPVTSSITQTKRVAGEDVMNEATLYSAVNAAGAGGALTMFANGFEAKKNWIEDTADILINANANEDVSYKVGGTLTVANDQDLTFNKGAGTKGLLVDINKLSIDGTSTLSFTGQALALDASKNEKNYTRIGDIELQDDANLTLGSAFFKPGDTAASFSWTGKLITNNSVTLTGANWNLAGRDIIANIDDTFILGSTDPDNLITGEFAISGDTTAGIKVDGKTTVTVVAPNSAETALRSGTATVGIFNLATATDDSLNPTKGDAYLLNEQNIEVVTDAYVSTGTMVNGTLTQLTTRLLDDVVQEAYAAALSAPAVMTLVNGGGA